MEGSLIFLGFLVITALIVIPIILLVMVSGLKSQISQLDKRILQLYQDLKKFAQQPVNEQSENNTVASDLAASHSARTYTTVYTIGEAGVQPEPLPEVEIAFVPETVEAADTTNPIEEYISEQPESEQEVVVDEFQINEPVNEEPTLESEKQLQSELRPPQPPTHSPRSKQVKSNFNFEKFIGENLINKIGIGVLVIGIGLFVKYAIDNEWINEIGRVLIGFLCGGVLLAVAYRFRTAYRAFSSVLTGGAMVVFYFTVAIAFREYGLFGQTTSFVMMVAITAFSVWLSILYNRRELAVLSLIGGMLTPFMVSRGDGNYHVLFTYIAILDIGILTLSLRKQWKELLVISFLGTQLIFGLYYSQNQIQNVNRDVALLLYASVFYIIFLLMPLVQVFRGKDKSEDHALHTILLIANSFAYILIGILLLNLMELGHYKGLLAALLAVVNALVAKILYNNKENKQLFLLFTGFVMSFVTLAAPLQFDGNYITLFWATEALLLLWLFRKSGTAIFYYGSLLLLACSFFNLMIDYSNQTLSFDSNGKKLAMEGVIFLNQYFITRIYVSLSFVFAGIILRRYCSEHPTRLWALPDWLPEMIGTTAACLLFFAGYRELSIYTNVDFTPYWCMAYMQVFLLVLATIVGSRSGVSLFRKYVIITLWGIASLGYWLYVRLLGSQREFLVYENSFGALPAILYWIGFAALCGLFVYTIHVFYKNYALKSSSGKTFTWIFNTVAVICLSIALTEALNQIGSFSDVPVSNKAGLTVLWSLCAFVQMWLGMRFKYKTLRIISLSLLGLVLCKLFLFDLQNVSQGAKIIAFVVLGVVLLVLSFLYQKLKKILFDEDEASDIKG